MTKQQRIYRAAIRYGLVPLLLLVGIVYLASGRDAEALLTYVLFALFMIWMELKDLRHQLAERSVREGARNEDSI